MRRISRIDRPIGLLQRHSSTRTPSTYQCLACKYQRSSLSTSSVRPSPSDDKTPFTEKMRQRIWGTDQPPGLDDPYGDGSVFDKTKKGPREQKVRARKEKPVQAPVKVEDTEKEGKDISADDTRQFGNSNQATTWDGLRWVGGGPIWQPEENFKGFLPANAATHPEMITAALHRSMVEVFALKQAGKQLHQPSTHFPETDGFYDWTYNVQITPSSSGATIEMPEHSSLQEVMESLTAPEMTVEFHEPRPTESEQDIDADRSEVDPLKPKKPLSSAPIPSPPAGRIEGDKNISEDQTLNESVVEGTLGDVISSWDPSWLEISLENPEVKFAILKRTMQLTGIQFPDASIKSSNTARSLLNILVTPPKPRKLWEALEQKDDLVDLPNVTIYNGKRTFYAKESDIGRLKVIQEELRAKGLEL